MERTPILTDLPADRTDEALLRGRPVTAEEVMDAVLSGAWVVDLREEVAQRQEPTAHVGWLVPTEDDLLLLTDDPTRLPAAAARLAELGLEGAA